jgi:hypothetical protein
MKDHTWHSVNDDAGNGCFDEFFPDPFDISVRTGHAFMNGH